MHTLNPADCLALVIAAGISLYVGYRIIKWLADRVIDSIGSLTRFED